MYNFIHIPKNAGTSIKKNIDSNLNLKSFIKYNDHNTCVFKSITENNVIILRDPIDRFCSAVNYTIKKKKRNK